jgi:hypothetical protein
MEELLPSLPPPTQDAPPDHVTRPNPSPSPTTTQDPKTLPRRKMPPVPPALPLIQDIQLLQAQLGCMGQQREGAPARYSAGAWLHARGSGIGDRGVRPAG